MIKTIALFVPFCLLALNLNHAQNVLKGCIKDQITSKNIPFASINYQKHPVGVYGNEDGYFELTFKKELPDTR